ncbi:Sugar (and other) transporter [Geosmithia morbida]|uniref:Sugar (And other) transporter n=1 Tax=Geosmithia morbida TaxID=1094350 RepID=A0A9P5D2P2_9HYPO|nr:Sugar (and other) transporter [Geosmithia morbida]KAF4124082.1 Sugar (and other) transporter [Geosmithia morbida]
MGLGILEPKGLITSIPGTTRFFDNDPDVEPVPDLKFADCSGKQCIILIPQPSDDPNDPLNWPLWRRDTATLTLCFVGALATSLGPILAANTITVAGELSRPPGDVVALTGCFLLGSGAGAVLAVPSARTWGKRHIFLLATCVILASSIWAGTAGTDYKSLVAARVVQGAGAAPFESLLGAAVGDMYHVHQRGVRMACAGLSVSGAAFSTPVIAGVVTRRLGWQWTFHIVSILAGAALPAVLFLCPEMAYVRGEERSKPSTSSSADGCRRHKTFIQSLAPFDGRKTENGCWALLLRPFVLLANPTFVWVCLIQGTTVGWTVFVAVVLATIFIGPPYHWTEVQAGYAYGGAFAGALVGFAVAGLLADATVRWLARRNGGLYEPEFRIVLVGPMFVAGGVGLFGFAVTAGQVLSGRYAYIVPLVFVAFEVAGMVIGAVASSLYIIDANRHLAIEGFTIMVVIKNMLSFGLTFKAFEWIMSVGIKETVLPIAGVQVAICALSIPMYHSTTNMIPWF